MAPAGSQGMRKEGMWKRWGSYWMGQSSFMERVTRKKSAAKTEHPMTSMVCCLLRSITVYQVAKPMTVVEEERVCFDTWLGSFFRGGGVQGEGVWQGAQR